MKHNISTKNSVAVGRWSLACLIIACVAVVSGCDSNSPDAQDLLNRLAIANNGFDSMRIDADNSIVEVDGQEQLRVVAMSNGNDSAGSYASDATWISRDTSIATVDNNGLVSGVADGNVVLVSRLGPLVASITLQVSSAEVTSIAIEPASATVNECGNQQFVARGIYAANEGRTRNITKEVNWQVTTDSSIAYFDEGDEAGLLRTSNAGTATLVASRAGLTDATVTINVLDNLTGISIPESGSTLTTNNSVQYKALATYQGDPDGTTTDITDNASWLVDNTTIATIDNTLPSKGLLDASQNGSVGLTATCGGLTSEVRTVLAGEPNVIESLSIAGNNPLSFEFVTIETRSLKSFAQLQNGVSVDITEESEWTVVGSGHANFELNNNAGFKGQLKVSGPGEIKIEIKYVGDTYDPRSDRALNIPSLDVDVR